MLQEAAQLATEAAGQDGGVSTPGDTDKVIGACSPSQEKNCSPGMEILPIVTGLPPLKMKGSSSWLRCLQALGKKGGCFWLPIKAAL